MLHNYEWSCKSQEMLKGKFLINNYMKDFGYYGLFPTEGSKAELKTWLINSNCQLETLNSELVYLTKH